MTQKPWRNGEPWRGIVAESLKYGIQTYVDEIDDGVNRAYAAWPTRLYLVGLDGQVVYAAGPGPYGFKPAELAEAIKAYLAEVPAAGRPR